MQCKNCGSHFPCRIKVDGKTRNLKNRKYCLKCSPFGKHNTKSLGDVKKKPPEPRFCIICEKEIRRKSEKGRKCWTCTNRINREVKKEKIKEFTGDACWVCGYNTCWAALDFHHVYAKDKKFQLTLREFQFTWDRIFSELRKCVLLCCRCHREVHYGLIDDEIIVDLWKSKWAAILKN